MARVYDLPSAAKFVQTTAFVYGEIIRRFTEFLSRPNACLIINGYGFSDDHINRLVVSALQNPTLQLIIYLPEVDRLGLYESLAATGDAIKPNEQLKTTARTTATGDCTRVRGAFSHALANDLPEPAMLDEVSERARQLEAPLSKRRISTCSGSPLKPQRKKALWRPGLNLALNQTMNRWDQLNEFASAYRLCG